MARRSKNSILILVILVVIVGVIAWSCTRNKNENMTSQPQKQSSSTTRRASSTPQMPVQAQNPPDMDYEMIYGNPRDSFGIGAGAAAETTNEWTLLG